MLVIGAVAVVGVLGTRMLVIRCGRWENHMRMLRASQCDSC